MSRVVPSAFMSNKRSQVGPLLRLSDAARAGGVSVQQLQYYLMLGLLGPTELSSGNQRLFDDRAVRRIRMLRLLNKGGYPLREIRDIFIERKGRGAKR